MVFGVLHYIITFQSWYDEFISECPEGKMNKEKFIAMYSILAVVK